MYDFRQLDHQHGLDTTVARVVFGFWVVNVSGKHLPFAALEIAVVVDELCQQQQSISSGRNDKGGKRLITTHLPVQLDLNAKRRYLATAPTNGFAV